MTKIARATQKIFAVDAGVTGVTEFGSTAAGSTAYSYDLSSIQTTAFTDGWLAGILAGSGTKRLPVYEDMNAIHYVATSQLAYLLQEGIPEYDAGTTYYANSIVKKANSYLLYGSVTDSNVGNPLTDAANWKLLIDLENNNNIYVTVETDNYSLLATDIGKCFVMNSASAKAFSLPIIGDGYYYYLKNIGAGTVTITPFGTNTTDATTLYTDESIILVADFVNSKWRTLAKFNVQATNTISGILKTSTQAQVNAGADTLTAVTPATLSGAITIYMPPGAVTAYAGTTAPSGYLMCDGSSQLISSYPTLSSVIRSTFGGADGSHFYLPNLNNGSFIRGLGGNSAGLGVSQGYNIQSHLHDLHRYSSAGDIATFVAASGSVASEIDIIKTDNTGDVETRPLNMALNYIIKI